MQAKKKTPPWHGIEIGLFASRAIALPLSYSDIGSRSRLTLMFSGFILDRGFAGFPQFEKMPHKIYVGASRRRTKLCRRISINLLNKVFGNITDVKIDTTAILRNL